ncbi:alpha-amylase family protein [Pseudomonas sp. F(2018)]|uniref:alpha-amylase family protein n=1 Tax=Pseudomonas sp. F(2018) TaxID=2502240 RepID=UPI0010F89A06|nr:alpha-amylase family protein [Pseudomonas sp. F(2018)]
MEANDVWYDSAVSYQLDVATFHDSNGDGIGDFPGLTARMDYLRQLGINSLLLMPFHPSSERDDGYDVIDHYGIDPHLGSFGDFSAFMDEARVRGIRVILDLVVNHTSDQHPWFQASRHPGSPFRDYYVWVDEPDDAHADQVMFPDRYDSVWTYDEQAGAYYFHRFHDFEPSLNHGNPEVRQEVMRILSFWLAMGVDGFRVDAAPYLILPKGPAQHFSDPHEYLRQLRRHASRYGHGAMLVGEANVPPEQLGQFFGNGDGLNQLFNFIGAERIFLALAREDGTPIRELEALLPPLPPSAQWMNFLRHHDELNLAWLDETTREELLDAIAPHPHMRIYGRGTRRRLAPLLGDPQRVRLALSLLFSRSGAPLLYYGDELGMGDNLELPDRFPVRTPMQWSAQTNGGFSCADPQRLIRPMIADGEYGYARVNVTEQWLQPQSQLNATRALIETRRSCPEFGLGRHEFIECDGGAAVLAESYFLDHGRVVCVHNLSRSACTVRIRHPELADRDCYELISRQVVRADAIGALELHLAPYGYTWWRVGSIFSPAENGATVASAIAEAPS